MNSPERRYAPESLTDRVIAFFRSGPFEAVLLAVAALAFIGAAVIAFAFAWGVAR